MSELNTIYRGIERSTDVLAFPQESAKVRKRGSAEAQKYKSTEGVSSHDLLLGDIVICVPKAEAQAKMYGWGFYDEISRLLIHGTLHLLGYDHEKTVYMARKMRKKEQEILNAVKKMD